MTEYILESNTGKEIDSWVSENEDDPKAAALKAGQILANQTKGEYFVVNAETQFTFRITAEGTEPLGIMAGHCDEPEQSG